MKWQLDAPAKNAKGQVSLAFLNFSNRCVRTLMGTITVSEYLQRLLKRRAIDSWDGRNRDE